MGAVFIHGLGSLSGSGRATPGAPESKLRVEPARSPSASWHSHQEAVMSYIVRGVSQEVADEVRSTRRAPGYGHPAYEELATGTGPCRCCLQPFAPGRERRLLFTYRPPSRAGSLNAPGPVFIHAERCVAYAGPGFPDALRALPLAFEARAGESRVTALSAALDETPESQMERLFAGNAEWLHLRHAEAGCFIACVERS
jgi:hypothetical protein